MKMQKMRFELRLLAALCTAVCAVGAAQAVQVTGGGIGAVIGAEPGPSTVVVEAVTRAVVAPSAPLTLAQPRPWGGMKLDTNPFPAARVKR